MQDPNFLPPSLIKCSTCNNEQLITDPESGEIICGSCGVVISDKAQDDTHKEWRAFSAQEASEKARTGAATSLSRHDRGLTTIIGKATKDASGNRLDASVSSTFQRLRTWDSRIQIHSSTDRNLRLAFTQLDVLKHRLGLSAAIIEKTAYIYRKAEEKQLIRGRTVAGMLAACVYLACRETGTPRTLKDISLSSNIKRREIARNYRLLITELDIGVPIVDSAKCISRLANKIGISEKGKRHALDIMDQVMKGGISSGKNPIGLAATVLYISCNETEEYRSQHDIARSAGTTEVTIRNRLHDIRASKLDLN